MIKNIQVLRAIAAYMVVVHHMADFLRASASVDIRTHVGESGVDIFFAISGFIMMTTTVGSPKPSTFLWRRFSRIAPIYWCMTLAVYAVALVSPTILGSTRAHPDMLIKSLLFIPFQKTPNVIMPILYVGWTLNFEMFFYLLFAGTLALSTERHRIYWLAVTLGSFVVLGRMVDFQNVPLAFFTNPLLLEFLAGCIIGHVYVRMKARGTPALLLGITTLALGITGLIGFVFFGPEAPSPLAPFRPFYWGIPSTLIVAGAVFLELAGYSTKNRILIGQGNASYSVYLVHLFVIQLAAKVINKFFEHNDLTGVLLSPLIVLTVGAVGWVVHRHVELPLNALFRRVATKSDQA